MQQPTKRKPASYVGYGFLLGTVSGFLVAVVKCGPELLRRWSWAAGGGMGETKEWGEPLFYLIIFACIYGTVGAAVGTILGAITALIARCRR